ncbi:predicted protein [Thalassiosira pseudonana CCMP1335]|uniref:Uncharacterized protein n=1 Tax=Thalassiosira pseudonana TaxID=35128 RepID=B8C5Z5_THAPS|nr:predicted protein [Thalassiosira pseudonana CCMP1335]EED91595.1 predicted protein [Thalassiosira pseudonana CCMP1335]
MPETQRRDTPAATSTHRRTPSRQGKKKHKHHPAPFFPNSPTSVGSPKDNGAHFYPRRVLQRTPKKLCSLVLPPPLTSLFDANIGTINSSTTQLTTAEAAVIAARLVASDNASVDGHSIMDASYIQTPPAVQHSSNASLSASIVGGGGASVNVSTPASVTNANHNPQLPMHLRVGMAACDPLIVFDGTFVLVATCDGRVAVYSIIDFDRDISEDIEASERRRRAEWEEEDLFLGQVEDDEKKEVTNQLEDTEEEEEEWETRERMHQRESAKQHVEPILLVTIPNNSHLHNTNALDIGLGTRHSVSEDEDSTSNIGQALQTPPTIVAMCATPQVGTSLIEQREGGNPLMGTQTGTSSAPSFVPTFGERLMGHVAVLTDDGEVHLLEFLYRPTMVMGKPEAIDSEASSSTTPASSVPSHDNNVPFVNVVLSHRTGFLGATCICMHQTNKKMRICIGYESGVLAEYQVYSTCLPLRDRSLESGNVLSPTSREQEEATISPSRPNSPPVLKKISNAQQSHSEPYSFARSKSNDLPRPSSDSRNSSVGSNLSSIGGCENADERTDLFLNWRASPRALFRTFSEPIDPSREANRSDRLCSPADVELCWRGSLGVPVRSLSSPGWGCGQTNEQLSPVVVGLEQRQSESGPRYEGMAEKIHHDLSPAISLEVINTSVAEIVWNETTGNVEKESADQCIALQDCTVWPAPGMEIKDGWIRNSAMSTKDSVFAKLGLKRVSVTSKICCFEKQPSYFASAASDGTVAISHYNTDGTWGILCNDNQFMLFQKCIGLGAIEYEESRYICCCLRGGTLYLVPVSDTNNDHSASHNKVTILVVPVDPSGEDDGVIRYIQNFASGVVRVSRWKEDHRSSRSEQAATSTAKSVALMGWSGGIVDVVEVTPGEPRYKY